MTLFFYIVGYIAVFTIVALVFMKDWVKLEKVLKFV